MLDQAEKTLATPATADRTGQVKDARINRLEETLAIKNEVLAELMEANVHLKNANGEL